MKKISRFLIARDIKRYFGFLFERGFEIREILCRSLAFGNWSVVLESPNCLIIIASERDEIFLSFAPLNTDKKDRVCIEAMIYFLSEGKIFIGGIEGNRSPQKKKQFEKLASLLIKHIDQITPYFGSEFAKHKDELFSVQKEYNDRLVKWYGGRM